jgi:signal transduction histidine kinase
VSVADQQRDVSVAPSFLSVMAHELAQPLTAALGSAYTLKKRSDSGALDDVTREHLFETIIRNLEQLQALLNSLQVFSEAEAGNLKVKTAMVWVEELFAEAKEDFGTPSSRTQVSFFCTPGLRVEVELMLFRQVLSNLISNAAKFSPNGSMISVEAHKHDQDVIVFTVSDEGSGFPPEEAERIFGKSVRLQPGEKGLGVGLYVAKAIVEAHGGRIWAENTHRGARFSVAIPAAT